MNVMSCNLRYRYTLPEFCYILKKHIFHAIDSFFILKPLCSHNSSKSKAIAGVGDMFNVYGVYGRLIRDYMSTGNVFDPFGSHRDLVFPGALKFPSFFILSFSMICSARVMAVPLGASSFWV